MSLKQLRRLALPLLAGLTLAAPAWAQTKPRIEKAADLPRFTYKVDGKVEDLVKSGDRFNPFAAAVRRDVESVLDGYEIADKATQRGLLNQIAVLDFLEGRYDDALKRLDQVRALQDKPADKLMSGLRLQSMTRAAKATGQREGEAYTKFVAEDLRKSLDAMPFEVVANDVRELKASAELIGETLVLGGAREVLQPIVDRTGTLSSEFTPGIVSARLALTATLPLKKILVSTFTGYLDAHKVVKPDIWAARDVVLDPAQGLSPVRIAVWDSGVDITLFGPQLAKGPEGRPVAIAYDKYSKPSKALLAPLTPDVEKRLDLMAARSKGFSDLQSNIDSPEAAEVKQYLSTLAPADYRKAIEELGMIGNYEHGTHVAGIALAGNPFARLVVARLEFDYHLQPDPCPSRAQALADAVAARKTVAFLKAQKVRVVNMSWGGDVGSIESAMEQCGIGKTPEERKAQARVLFEIQKKSLTEAFRSAPEILFVTAAGNSNNDPSFVEDVPAAIVLPNMLTVGAVDQAGDEASFTSYGQVVKVHANGYQVESTLPGGKRVALSGTSMASPQVANLAGKLLAVNPKLTPPELVKIIVDTADSTPDGRRHLVNPKKALAAAKG
ncbi:MAG: S8 family serine peptidase [Burkholderiales bacterium]|nr:S8 family serine peptidase [Burkholderiales bacterium]